MSNEQITKAISKLKSAQICHPSGVQYLIEEAIDLMESEAGQEPNDFIEIDHPCISAGLSAYRQEMLMHGKGSYSEHIAMRAAIIAAIRAKGAV